MTTFALGFEGYIGVCHVQNRMFHIQRWKQIIKYGGKLVRLWIDAGSRGAGIAMLRDPGFLLVMVERSHLFVISGGYQKEAYLDDLER